ncbi:hypothetical protein A0H81_07349 [Grifola frondosa]|uniref:Uncharacterized protein n=1 Tax=Grifola frondosa TaxID=5627 RepID=A0A1C7M7J1_GRIFR|nr:hypothetical protein A0H81_07349 [Grifola frondosa]
MKELEHTIRKLHRRARSRRPPAAHINRKSTYLIVRWRTSFSSVASREVSTIDSQYHFTLSLSIIVQHMILEVAVLPSALISAHSSSSKGCMVADHGQCDWSVTSLVRTLRGHII